LKELASLKREGKRQIKDAAAFLYSEEFAAFLVKDPSTTGIITDIYDYKATHEVVLKSEETMKLEHVCITMLSATNAAFLKDMFTQQDLYGGLVGRTMFIIEEKARHKDLGFRDSTVDQDWEPLIHHLIKLSQIEGHVRFEESALLHLEDWYMQTDFTKNESKTGYEHRAHTHVTKLALILAACEENFDKTIQLRHIERAIETISTYRKNYLKLVSSISMSTNSIVEAGKGIVLTLIKSEKPELTKREILNRMLDSVDVETFDKAVITLEQKGLVQLTGSSIALYSLTDYGRELILGGVKAEGKVN
jgi:hypothetical protein